MLRTKISLLLSLLCFVPMALAQGNHLRPPHDAEKKVLAKYTEAINHILDQFQGDDWDETVDYSVDDQVLVHTGAGVPLDMDEMFQRTYNVRPDSSRYNTIVKPAMEKMTRAQQTSDYSAMKKAGDSIQDFLHLQVQVHCNVEPPQSIRLQLRTKISRSRAPHLPTNCRAAACPTGAPM